MKLIDNYEKFMVRKGEAFSVLVKMVDQALDQADYLQIDDYEAMAYRMLDLSREGWPLDWFKRCPRCAARMKQTGGVGPGAIACYMCEECGSERVFVKGVRVQSLEVGDFALKRAVNVDEGEL